MPVEPYPTKVVDGHEYWVIETLVPKESDPERGAYIFFAKPLPGMSGIPGLVQGDPGPWTEILEEVNMIPLEHDDPTPDSMSFTVTQPGGPGVPQRVQLNATNRKGRKGADGNATWDPTDLSGSPVAGQVPAVKSTGDGFELVQPKVVRSHWPGSLNNAPSGTTATFQLGVVNIAAGTYKSPYRLHINAGATVIGSSSDLKVDIIARLGAADGPIIGYGHGVSGMQTQRTVVISGPPAGTAASNEDYFVAGGAAATVFLMAEKKSGAATYSTTEPWFSVGVEFV
ncbi:hypothetical protein M2272_005845 [Mycobacterium frederiksbergense]|uniref:Minor tail protein n=1 Tax=Mycolicibacterium frederiksbergense TaxID=117567 RepID=A0ABT6L897_9MYCO|nr:hypothetical protein [Mycolicibacterium frederiksbergense]MDH6199177.1 hypothetical protein [Mycolicibacterium frederiksbergense]